MHTPIVAGRAFNETDNNPQARRIIIDEVLAAKAFPNGAVGQRLLSRFQTTQPEWFEIIGVAAHQRMTSLADPGREQGYLPGWILGTWRRRPPGPSALAAIRRNMRSAVRAAMGKFDRTLLVTECRPWIPRRRAQTGTRFSLVLIAAFAAIAVLLAGVGLYGVLSTVVRQRTAEIGVRMALGAAPSGIFGLMIGTVCVSARRGSRRD